MTLHRALPGYMPALDGLRGVAVLLVLACHLYVRQFPGGAIGVDVFFALSGFLITSILIREFEKSRRIRFGRFYIRRLIRLYPALLATLALALVPTILFFGDVGLRETIAAATYTTPFARDIGLIDIGPFEHTWSLTVEEVFYLFWPVVLLGIAVAGFMRRSAWVVIGIGLATLLTNVAIEAGGGHPYWILRAGGMLLGCGAAFATAAGGRPSRWLPGAALVGLTASVVIWNRPGGHSVAILIAAGSASILIARIATTPDSVASKSFSFFPLVWIGTISYELYLVHFPIIVLSTRWLVGTDVRRQIWVAACAIASVLIAAAIHYALAPLQRSLRDALEEKSNHNALRDPIR